VTQSTAGPAARATADRADTRDDPIVVLGGPAPDWLRAWCRATGRRLDPRPDIEVGSAAPLIATGPPEHELASG